MSSVDGLIVPYPSAKDLYTCSVMSCYCHCDHIVSNHTLLYRKTDPFASQRGMTATFLLIYHAVCVIYNTEIRLLKEVGLEERFTAHQLRHTYATIAANSGNVPPKVLQGMLGHANFQTTMNIYAGLDNDRVRESSQGLSNEYAKLSKESCSEIAVNKSSKSAAPSGI